MWCPAQLRAQCTFPVVLPRGNSLCWRIRLLERDGQMGLWSAGLTGFSLCRCKGSRDLQTPTWGAPGNGTREGPGGQAVLQ